MPRSLKIINLKIKDENTLRASAASDCKEEKDMKAAHCISLYSVDVRLLLPKFKYGGISPDVKKLKMCDFYPLFFWFS